MKIGAFAGSVCLALCASAIAQETLTNDSIEKMAKARLGDDVYCFLDPEPRRHCQGGRERPS